MRNIKTLHQLCEEIGVTRRAVQGYEMHSLVKPSAKNKYGHLLYDEQAQKRIAVIKDYQRLGFSLKEIESLIDASDELVTAALERQVVKLQEEHEEKAVLIDMAKEWIATIQKKGEV